MYLRLDEDEQVVDDLFAQFFATECSIERVRAAAPLGHDRAAWERLAETGAPTMSAPEAIGGGGADLATTGVAVSHLGRHIAPVPLIEHVVALRLMAATGVAIDDAAAVVSGASIATVALRGTGDPRARLVPAGAVAEVVVGWSGEDLVMAVGTPPGTGPRNTADLPLADRTLSGAVIGSGAGAESRWAHARAEWQALMAVALVGLGRQGLEIGVEYVKQRHQFGVPVGSFQAIQHGLADAAAAMEGAHFLANRAVWALDRGRDDAAELAAMAFLFAAEAAQATTGISLQYHGGYGFAEEYDIQLYYRRAKGWPLQLGPPHEEYQRLADRRLPKADV